MLLLAVASGNFPISSVVAALGHSNRGSLVRISSVEVDLSVTFGAGVSSLEGGGGSMYQC